MRFSDSYKWYSTCKQRKIKTFVYDDVIITSYIVTIVTSYIGDILGHHPFSYYCTYCYIVHWNIWVCDVIYCYTIMTSHTSMCCDGIATPQLCNKMMTLLHHVDVTHSAGLWCHLSLLLMSECDITAIAYWCYILMIFVMSW